MTGIIRREDVDRYADAMRAQAASASATAAPAAPGTPGARETRIPIRGVRKHTAAAMVQSAFTAPHVTTFLEVDVTETVRLVADLRADRRLKQGIFFRARLAIEVATENRRRRSRPARETEG